jgi:putative acetyltransferase
VIEGEISTDDPRAPDVRALLGRHLTFARQHTPPEDVHALEVDALVDPAVTFYSFRRNGELLAVGALKRLDAHHAELKSMHTAEAARRQGVGAAMLDHLVAVARARGFHRLSLETGTMDAFAAARSLYANRGFRRCDPYGDYVASPNSICMSMMLESDINRIE